VPGRFASRVADPLGPTETARQALEAGLEGWGTVLSASELLVRDQNVTAGVALTGALDALGIRLESLDLRRPDPDLYLLLAEDALSRGDLGEVGVVIDGALATFPDDWRVITAQGARAGEVAEGGWPADRLGTGGRQWVVSESELESQLERWSARCRELEGGWVSEDAWNHAHVIRGRPRFGVDFGDWTYPQETGLNPVAVSFGKGCYIGQETVVMLENRGKAPKVLWRWTIESAEPPEAKASIEQGDVVVGEITSAVLGDASVSALGFVKRGFEPQGPDGFAVLGAPAHAVGPVETGPGVCPSPT